MVSYCSYFLLIYNLKTWSSVLRLLLACVLNWYSQWCSNCSCTAVELLAYWTCHSWCRCDAEPHSVLCHIRTLSVQYIINTRYSETLLRCHHTMVFSCLRHNSNNNNNTPKCLPCHWHVLCFFQCVLTFKGISQQKKHKKYMDQENSHLINAFFRSKLYILNHFFQYSPHVSVHSVCFQIQCLNHAVHSYRLISRCRTACHTWLSGHLSCL